MESSQNLSPHRAGPSHSHSRSEDSIATPGRKRVGFTAEVTPPDGGPLSTRSPEEAQDTGSTGHNTPRPVLLRSDVSHEELSEEIHKAFGEVYVPRPRPAIRKLSRTPPQFFMGDETDEDNVQKRSGIAALERANRLARSIGNYSASAPGSRRNSNDKLIGSPPMELHTLRPAFIELPTDVELTHIEEFPQASPTKHEFMEQADQLLRRHTVRHASALRPEDLFHTEAGALRSGQVTPRNEAEMEDEHVPRPTKYRTGVLGTLLKASNTSEPPVAGVDYKFPDHERTFGAKSSTFSGASTAANSVNMSPGGSGSTTPDRARAKHWYSKSANISSGSIAKLLESSSMLATTGQTDFSSNMGETYKKQPRPGMGKRNRSNDTIKTALNKLSKRDEEIKIKIHLAGLLARQNYLRKLCKALMMYGAPTHRLEEYMNMSARVLEIEAQFLYMPGCMIIAFDDSSVHTSEVKLVRTNQGVDLGKLRDVHEIYKDVVHDRIGVDEATPRLETIMRRKAKFNPWLRVPVYGLASATVGPFAFQARPIDLPFCFILGCILGWLQLVVMPTNELLSNVFEISAAVITSFLARGLGSIRHNGKEIFCFSAMAQSSIALILPGFTVLSASLELQSRHIVAGSVRMVYAIIYSLFLGYGITIGTVLFGLMYHDATSNTTCKDPMSSHWYYFFVMGFTMCLMIINQAKYKQMPSMLIISLIGYVVNFHSSQYFKKNAQVANTLGALAIGVTANLHARFGRYVENWSLDFYEDKIRPRWVTFRKSWLRRSHGPRSHTWNPPKEGRILHSRSSSTTSDPYIPHIRKIGYGLAAAAMLPAIFVQVPSGLSVSGSLVSGIQSADQITRNTTNVTTTITAAEASSSSGINSVALNVGFSVIQIAIGITVGLFLAALLVYPLGKRRSGLFSF
jgi:uncharacterized membrane protein YjjP (DUF1212 family)